MFIGEKRKLPYMIPPTVVDFESFLRARQIVKHLVKKDRAFAHSRYFIEYANKNADEIFKWAKYDEEIKRGLSK